MAAAERHPAHSWTAACPMLGCTSPSPSAPAACADRRVPILGRGDCAARRRHRSRELVEQRQQRLRRRHFEGAPHKVVLHVDDQEGHAAAGGGGRCGLSSARRPVAVHGAHSGLPVSVLKNERNKTWGLKACSCRRRLGGSRQQIAVNASFNLQHQCSCPPPCCRCGCSKQRHAFPCLSSSCASQRRRRCTHSAPTGARHRHPAALPLPPLPRPPSLCR